jgi:bifunctional non-homologous end joining protein LigD
MARPPKKLREISRKADAPERLVSRPIVPRKATRTQAGLFDERATWTPPMLATPRAIAPSGPQWAHEIKWDGYRIVAVVDHGNVRLYSRRGLDWSARMPAIVQALGMLVVRSAVIDGEAVIADDAGIPDFFAIRAAIGAGHAPAAAFIAFDLMHLDGEDFRDRPLDDRRAALFDVIGQDSEALQFSREIPGEGPAAFEAACRMGLGGIVSKRRDSRYRSGHSLSWIKTKCTLTDVANAGPRSENSAVITGSMLAKARRLTGLRRQALARLANLPNATLRRAELSPGEPMITIAQLSALRSALKEAGIDFIADERGSVTPRLRK